MTAIVCPNCSNPNNVIPLAENGTFEIDGENVNNDLYCTDCCYGFDINDAEVEEVKP